MIKCLLANVPISMLSLDFMVVNGTVGQETGGFGLCAVGRILLPEVVVSPLI